MTVAVLLLLTTGNGNDYEPDTSREENDSLEPRRYPASTRSTTVLPPPPPPKSFHKGPHSTRSCGHYKPRSSDERQSNRNSGKEYGLVSYGSGYGRSANNCSPRKPDTRPPQKTFLWVAFSSIYGKLLVLVTIVLCITEIVNNDINIMQYQSFFFLYLYLGSSLVIVCIYVYTVLSRAPPSTPSHENLTQPRDPEIASINSFGTLKKAYIQRAQTARTCFYLRVGALVFGLGTLIYTGLEIAVHTTVDTPCVDEIAFVHPILQAIFTFLQMHFLFVNSQVVIEASGVVARLGFMHLVATNLGVWIRMVSMDGALEEARFILANKSFPSTIPPTTAALTVSEASEELGLSPGSIVVMAVQKGRMQHLYNCLHKSTLGRMWMEAIPFLLPFILQFCLIAAAVYYVMWRNVGQGKTELMLTCTAHSRRRSNSPTEVKECHLTQKGLFLGLLVLVSSVVVLVIFFVMQAKVELYDRLVWIALGTVTGVLFVAVVVSLVGLVVVQRLAYIGLRPLHLDRLLSTGTSFAVYFHGLLVAVAGGSMVIHPVLASRNTLLGSLLLVYGLLVVIHAAIQGSLLSEAARRRCITHNQLNFKPGRQVLTTLLFCNAALWLLDTFLTSSKDSQFHQAEFYGPVLWGYLVRINLPIMVLNRFHSTVMLYEIWKMAYSQ